MIQRILAGHSLQVVQVRLTPPDIVLPVLEKNQA
jgi:hypothetical protein